jgi:hypothetical protein
MVRTTGQYARIAALSIARLRPAITRGPHMAIAADVLNRMLELGRPEYVRIA